VHINLGTVLYYKYRICIWRMQIFCKEVCVHYAQARGVKYEITLYPRPEARTLVFFLKVFLRDSTC
jgi:hypothetical protein